MKRFLLFTIMPFMALGVFAQQSSDYVDLGLPSGTLWKSYNEPGGLYSYDEAIAKFGNQLPTYEQFAELYSVCDWIFISGGAFKVIGPNGKFIKFTLDGFGASYSNGKWNILNKGYLGCYWTSTQIKKDGYKSTSYVLSCDKPNGIRIHEFNNLHPLSIRLVKK